MSNIKSLLHNATADLGAYSESARLDAEVLLTHVLHTNRSYLYAHLEHDITAEEIAAFMELLQRRQNGEPIAYILGEKEFWSLPFKVTPDTLIPRPETELLIELAFKKLPSTESLHIADLGTGSGAIAVSLAYERKNWQLHATDQCEKALSIAKENSKRLTTLNVSFFHGEWCKALPQQKYSAIISNPPYIAQHDKHLQQGDLRFEPLSALVSGVDGLQDIRTILHQAYNYLVPNGLIMLEHGYQQAPAVRTLMHDLGYSEIESHKDLQGHERVTSAKMC